MILSSFSPALLTQQCSARPVVGFFRAPGIALSSLLCALEESEGARDAGVAADPRTSTPHGAEATRWRTGLARRRSGRCRYEWVATAASLPVPRHPARGVYRLAPRDPRWADLSGA